MLPNLDEYVDPGYSDDPYTIESTGLFDDDLDNIISANLVLLTGLDASLVRPRFQPEPATQPSFSTNWIAFGVSNYDSDVFAHEEYNPLANGGTGASTVERDELVSVKLSFYGPNNGKLIRQYRDGLQIESIRWALSDANMALVEIQQVINLPALLKDRWVKRLDTTIIFRRRVATTYNVPYLLSGASDGSSFIDNEISKTPINTPTS